MVNEKINNVILILIFSFSLKHEQDIHVYDKNVYALRYRDLFY